MTSHGHIEWRADPYWQHRRLNPAQLLVYDIGVSGNSGTLESMLEINEVLPSSFLPALHERDRLADWLSQNAGIAQPQEQQRLQNLASEYGWMNCLRCPDNDKGSPMADQLRKCRWIFSDWSEGNVVSNIITNRHLGQIIQQYERFSKHGRYFSPFLEPLSPNINADENGQSEPSILLSLPFVDWAIAGEPPPLRFQVDPREGFQSSRTSVHSLRTLLQHFYRLEETRDREQSQVFANHKPWKVDALLDLKVRRWYGHYPESLNVDELWILVVDARHIVTFSSNQSWKSRWPPLQLASRIAEVSFRGLRNDFFMVQNTEYSAYQHVAACLNGAVGLLHRSFWPDMPLCMTDRFAGYLEHIQYRLHRAPSSKLVMDLLQLQEELGIVVQIMKHQLDLALELRAWLNREVRAISSHGGNTDVLKQNLSRPRRTSHAKLLPQVYWSTPRQHESARQSDPISQLLENLNREHADLCDLRESSSNIIDRTIKLVNLRLEDHGKAVLVFTIITVVFLPLSFLSSFFGMNFVDIRDTNRTQQFFWIVAGTATVGIVALSVIVAFFGDAIFEMLLNWREGRQRHRREMATKLKRNVKSVNQGIRNFEILNAAKVQGS